MTPVDDEMKPVKLVSSNTKSVAIPKLNINVPPKKLKPIELDEELLTQLNISVLNQPLNESKLPIEIERFSGKSSKESHSIALNFMNFYSL
jgi:hypothetical protein